MRVVRLVAIGTLHAAVVLGGGHLREPGGFGRVLLMAAVAQIGHVGQFGLDGRVAGVRRQRPVTGFAGDVSVLAGGAGFGLVIVAQNALVLAGVSDGALAEFGLRGGAVVAVLSEGLGDD